MIAVATFVLVCDLASKAAAEQWIPRSDFGISALGYAMRLVVFHNDQSAFGVSLGLHTLPINIAMTMAAIALVVPVTTPLGELDRWSPYSLGLIVGAAFGNLISMILSASGVTDFVAIDYGAGYELVLNVADIAAYLGLALMLRTMWLIVKAMRSEREAVIVGWRVRIDAVTFAARPVAMEAEVALPIHSELPPRAPATGRKQPFERERGRLVSRSEDNGKAAQSDHRSDKSSLRNTLPG